MYLVHLLSNFLAVCNKVFEKRRAEPNDANGSSDPPSTEWPRHARKIKKLKGTWLQTSYSLYSLVVNISSYVYIIRWWQEN